MKLKDIFSKSCNSANNQLKLNLRKKKLKELGMTEEDLFNIKIDKTKEILK